MQKGMIRYAVFGVILALGSQVTAGSGYRKIVHEDGRVEFTDVTIDSKNTGNSKTTGGQKTRSQVTTSKSRNSVTTVYKYQMNNGVVSYSDSRPNSGVQLEVIRFGCFACDPTSTVDWQHTPLNLAAFKNQIDTAATSHALDPALVRAIIHAESGFNPKALSPQGAQGLMQLMPGTARELGVGNAFDTSENIRGGAKYLAKLLTMFNGDIRLAAAAYNAGPNAVRKHGDVPPYEETQTYVKRVGILHSRYQQALKS